MATYNAVFKGRTRGAKGVMTGGIEAVVVGMASAVVIEELWIRLHPQYEILSREELHNLYLENLKKYK